MQAHAYQRKAVALFPPPRPRDPGKGAQTLNRRAHPAALRPSIERARLNARRRSRCWISVICTPYTGVWVSAFDTGNFCSGQGSLKGPRCDRPYSFTRRDGRLSVVRRRRDAYSSTDVHHHTTRLRPSFGKRLMISTDLSKRPADKLDWRHIQQRGPILWKLKIAVSGRITALPEPGSAWHPYISCLLIDSNGSLRGIRHDALPAPAQDMRAPPPRAGQSPTYLTPASRAPQRPSATRVWIFGGRRPELRRNPRSPQRWREPLSIIAWAFFSASRCYNVQKIDTNISYGATEASLLKIPLKIPK